MDRSSRLTQDQIKRQQIEERKAIVRAARQSKSIQVSVLTRLFDLFFLETQDFYKSITVTPTQFAQNIEEAVGIFPGTPEARDTMVRLPQMELCTTIDEIGAMPIHAIEASCAMLDRIEMTALAYCHHSEFFSKFSVEDKLMYAFNARINFYRRFFVASGAKHMGAPVLVAACDYLRSLRLKPRERAAHTAQNQATLATMLGTIGASEAYSRGTSTYSFRGVDDNPPYQLRDPDQMDELGKKLYKAIQGQRIIQQLESQMGRAIVIGKDSLGVEKTVTVTRALIRSLPDAAMAISKAREWEERAYTSCLGSSNNSGSHVFERLTAQLLATIDFNNNPEDIMGEIRRLHREGNLKKYLKYKEKYLNLKKQLNLL